MTDHTAALYEVLEQRMRPGRRNFGYPTGDYAATLELLIPIVPADATLTGLTLTMISSGGDTVAAFRSR